MEEVEKIKQEQFTRQVLEARAATGKATVQDLAQLAALNAPPPVKPDSGRVIGTPEIDVKQKDPRRVLKQVYTETLPD